MGVFVFNCPHCGKQIGAQDEWEGKTTMCPHCQKPVVIRHPTPEASPFDGSPQQPMVSASEDFNVVTHEICPKAIISFGLGLGSFFFWCFCCGGWIISIVAIVFGILGLNEIKKSDGRLEGKGYAWIGIVLGIMTLMIVVIMWIIQMNITPQNMDTYKQLLDKYLNTN